MSPDKARRHAAWAQQDAAWREPGQALSLWQGAADIDPQLLAFTVSGNWWETLAATGRTLLISREYEHLLLALSVTNSGPRISFMPLPHPSGIAVNENRCNVYVASTRNPNQIFELQPVSGALARADVAGDTLTGHPLVPVRSRFLPGCTYLHDLALIGGVLHANAVGQNAIIRLHDVDDPTIVWWPAAVDRPGGPMLDRNYLQLNSIAPGSSLATSFFSASTDRASARRPGHRNFAVDQRGVIFSGATREPIARGLTRPHSARIVCGRLWVDNSGYGEVGIVDDGRFSPVVRLPGWTRGLHSAGHVAFVGTSQVIPRFRHYAPGLELSTSTCGLHAIDVQRGTLLGSLTWPMGNQIFAIESVPNTWETEFPWTAGRQRPGSHSRAKNLFYAYQLSGGAHDDAASEGIARFDTLARLPGQNPYTNGDENVADQALPVAVEGK